MGRGPSISNYERYVHFKLCLIKGRSLSIPPESAGIPEFRSIPVDSVGISGIPVNSGGIRGGIKSIAMFLSSESRNMCIPGPLNHNVPRARKAGVSQSRGASDSLSRLSKPAVYLGFFAMKWR